MVGISGFLGIFSADLTFGAEFPNSSHRTLAPLHDERLLLAKPHTNRSTSTTSDGVDPQQKFEIFVDFKILYENDTETFTVTIQLASGESPLTTEQSMVVTVRGSGEASAVDFTPVADFTITVAANANSGSASFTLTPENDTVDEVDETITITSTSNLVSGSATIDLRDDDAAPEGINLDPDLDAIPENEGRQVVTITATVEGTTTYATPQSIPISVAGSLGPTSVDFAPIGDFTIEIPAGQESSSGSFTVVPVDDNVDESDETLTVTTTSDNVKNKSFVILLRDDDFPPRGINLAISTNAVYEDLGAQDVKVSMGVVMGVSPTTYATDQMISLTATGTNKEGVVGFSAPQTFNILLPAESLTSSKVSFIITPVNNLIDEANEIITISSTSDLITGPAIINLVDDDPTPSIQLSVSPSSISEGAGSTQVTVNASLSSNIVFPSTVMIPLTIEGSGNASSVDFAPVPTTTLMIAKEASSGRATFSLRPIDDSEDEDSEIVTVKSTNGRVTNSPTIEITDNDDPPSNIRLSVAPSTIDEDAGRTSVTVTASIGSSSTFSKSTSFVIDITSSENTNVVDYSSVSNFSIVFRPSESTATETLIITPTNDDVETENEQITLSSESPLITTSAIIVLLDDDQDTSLNILLSADPSVISEGDGATIITVTGTFRDSQTPTENLTIPLTVRGSGQPDAVGFSPVSNFTLIMTAAQSSSSTTFVLTPEDDLYDQSSETVTIASTHSFVENDAIVTIEDNDNPTVVELSVTPAIVFEDRGPQMMTVTGTLKNPPLLPDDLMIPIDVRESGQDGVVSFASVSPFTLMIKAGESSGSDTFIITPEDDVNNERDETVTITSNHRFVPQDVTFTIQDDDEPGLIKLMANPTTIFEDRGEQTIMITGRIDNGIAFLKDQTYSLSIRGTAGPSAVDFESIPDVDLEFEAGDIQATTSFTVAPIDDKEFESDEILQVFSTDESIAGPVSIQLVNDDEKPPNIKLTVTPSSIAENAGPTEVTVQAAIEGTSLFSSSIDLPLTITGSDDPTSVAFLPISEVVLRIPARTSEAQVTFELTPQNNNTHQLDGVVTISSTNELVSTPVEIILKDDDPLPNAALLSVNPTSISESEGSTSFTVTATLQGATTFITDQIIPITTENSGVPTAVDYTTIPDFELTLPAKSINGSALIELTIEDDLIDEQNEVITFSSSYSLITNQARLTLDDDDATPNGLALSLDQPTLLESAGSVEVTLTTTLIGESRYASDKQYSLRVTSSGSPNAVKYSVTAPPTVTLLSERALTKTVLMIHPTDNLLDEINESLTITVNDDLVSAKTELSIVDDDEPPTGFVLDVTPDMIVEGDGPAQVTVTASVTGDSRYASTQTLQVSISDPQNGSVGYASVPSFTIDIPAGAPSESGNFTLNPQINTIQEQDAIITITATHLSGAVTTTMVLQDDDASTQRIADVNAGLLPEVTRAMISSSVGAINARFQSIRWSSPPISEFTHNLSHLAMRFQNRASQKPWTEPSLVSRLAHMTLAASIKDRITLWSHADYQSLSGDGDQYSVDYDGGLTAIHAGVDLAFNRFLVGMAVSQFFVDVDFKHFGGIRLTLPTAFEGLYQLNSLTVNPYASWAWSPTSRVWTMLSLGSGNAEVTDPEALPEEANTTLNAFAAGVEIRLLTAQSGFTLTGEGALWGGLSSIDQNISRIRELDVGVYRFQILVEGAYGMDVDNLGTFEPFIETGLRGDGGDGLTGAGVEMGGGTRLDLHSIGLQIIAHGHVLILHGSDVNEWGFGGSLRYTPSGTTGPNFEVRSLTGLPFGDSPAIWEDTRWYGQRSFIAKGTKLQSQFGYGFRMGHGTMTPYAGMSFGAAGVSQIGAEYRLGSHLSVRLESIYPMHSQQRTPSIRAAVFLR